MNEEKGTGAITGITNFLFLAFILPGIVYVFFILVLFPFAAIRSLFPGIEMGTEIAIGAVITLGLALTSVVFAFAIAVHKLGSFISWPGKAAMPGGTKLPDYAERIFDADRNKELGWYFWQVWGQSIMHQNIAWGLAMIYVVYKAINNELWPCNVWLHSWRDWMLAVIVANLVCWRTFSRWHASLMSKLT
jgi:hypothetical protein